MSSPNQSDIVTKESQNSANHDSDYLNEHDVAHLQWPDVVLTNIRGVPAQVSIFADHIKLKDKGSPKSRYAESFYANLSACTTPNTAYEKGVIMFIAGIAVYAFLVLILTLLSSALFPAVGYPALYYFSTLVPPLPLMIIFWSLTSRFWKKLLNRHTDMHLNLSNHEQKQATLRAPDRSEKQIFHGMVYRMMKVMESVASMPWFSSKTQNLQANFFEPEIKAFVFDCFPDGWEANQNYTDPEMKERLKSQGNQIIYNVLGRYVDHGHDLTGEPNPSITKINNEWLTDIWAIASYAWSKTSSGPIVATLGRIIDPIRQQYLHNEAGWESQGLNQAVNALKAHLNPKHRLVRMNAHLERDHLWFRLKAFCCWFLGATYGDAKQHDNREDAYIREHIIAPYLKHTAKEAELLKKHYTHNTYTNWVRRHPYALATISGFIVATITSAALFATLVSAPIILSVGLHAFLLIAGIFFFISLAQRTYITPRTTINADLDEPHLAEEHQRVQARREVAEAILSQSKYLDTLAECRRKFWHNELKLIALDNRALIIKQAKAAASNSFLDTIEWSRNLKHKLGIAQDRTTAAAKDRREYLAHVLSKTSFCHSDETLCLREDHPEAWRFLTGIREDESQVRAHFTNKYTRDLLNLHHYAQYWDTTINKNTHSEASLRKKVLEKRAKLAQKILEQEKAASKETWYDIEALVQNKLQQNWDISAEKQTRHPLSAATLNDHQNHLETIETAVVFIASQATALVQKTPPSPAYSHDSAFASSDEKEKTDLSTPESVNWIEQKLQTIAQQNLDSGRSSPKSSSLSEQANGKNSLSSSLDETDTDMLKLTDDQKSSCSKALPTLSLLATPNNGNGEAIEKDEKNETSTSTKKLSPDDLFNHMLRENTG